jgi:hypothetical protein
MATKVEHGHVHGHAHAHRHEAPVAVSPLSRGLGFRLGWALGLTEL